MISLALGKKGYGKSTALRRLLTARLRAHPDALVLAHDPGAQLRSGAVFESLEQFRRHAGARGVPRLSIFRSVEAGELAELALELGGCTLYADELDRLCDGKRWVNDAARRIVHEGRHLGVDLWGSFRSTRNVSEDVVHGCDAALLFHVSSAADYDLQTIRRRFGRDVAELLPTLELGQFILWRD